MLKGLMMPKGLQAKTVRYGAGMIAALLVSARSALAVGAADLGKTLILQWNGATWK
jgi:hypothetical protein